MTDAGQRKEAGYIIGERGKPIAAGVICKCPDEYCPAHGRSIKSKPSKPTPNMTNEKTKNTTARR